MKEAKIREEEWKVKYGYKVLIRLKDFLESENEELM